MYAAITTKYLPCTNTLPPRISAKAPDLPYMIMPWDDDISNEDNHRQAATVYADKYKWSNKLMPGWTKLGVVWVSLPNDR